MAYSCAAAIAARVGEERWLPRAHASATMRAPGHRPQPRGLAEELGRERLVGRIGVRPARPRGTSAISIAATIRASLSWDMTRTAQ